jgi:WXG100 family type VII secretion target
MDPVNSGSLSGVPLDADLGRIGTAAAHVDGVNGDIGTLLANIETSVSGLGGAAWSGMAYSKFKQIMNDWQDQSLKLNTALAGIADTLRSNSGQLENSEQLVTESLNRAGASSGPLNI